MSRIKMVLLFVLLLAAVVTTSATFTTGNGSVVKAECPASNETEGGCETNETDANFSTCKRTIGGGSGGNQGGHYVSVCFDDDCSYEAPGGGTVTGRCCTGGVCYREE